MPPESESDTLTPEAIAVQVIEENSELARRYATGDMTVLGTLQEKALRLGSGRVSESQIKDTLVRKLGASI